MLALTLSQAFAPSRKALEAPAMPADRFAAVTTRLAGRVNPLPVHAEAGRAAALLACASEAAQAPGTLAERRKLAAQRLLAVSPLLRANPG